jgi:hypothetical protein
MAKSSSKKNAAAQPQALDTGRIEKIAFSELGVSPLNVRKPWSRGRPRL